MEPLLSAIVTWLSLNFGMPAIHEHPWVQFAAPETMEAVRGSAETVLAAFDDYFEGRPRNAGLVVKIIPDDTMRAGPSSWTRSGKGRRPRSCRCWSTRWCTTCRTRPG